jgi:hypothetical protein
MTDKILRFFRYFPEGAIKSRGAFSISLHDGEGNVFDGSSLILDEALEEGTDWLLKRQIEILKGQINARNPSHQLIRDPGNRGSKKD